MTTVQLGTNSFTGFSAILGLGGRPVLRIDDNAAVYLWVPDGSNPASDLPRFEVTSDEAQDIHSPVLVVRAGDDTSRGLFLRDSGHAPVLTTRVAPSKVHVRLDLRPLGIAIHDDIDGLHIGGTRIAGQVLHGAGTAIWLG